MNPTTCLLPATGAGDLILPLVIGVVLVVVGALALARSRRARMLVGALAIAGFVALVPVLTPATAQAAEPCAPPAACIPQEWPLAEPVDFISTGYSTLSLPEGWTQDLQDSAAYFQVLVRYTNTSTITFSVEGEPVVPDENFSEIYEAVAADPGLELDTESNVIVDDDFPGVSLSGPSISDQVNARALVLMDEYGDTLTWSFARSESVSLALMVLAWDNGCTQEIRGYEGIVPIPDI